MLTLTCCQDHILTENIWFVWSKTSNCGNECYRCGTNNKQTLKIELLSQWKLEAEFRNIVHNEFSIKFVELCHHDRKKNNNQTKKGKVTKYSCLQNQQFLFKRTSLYCIVPKENLFKPYIWHTSIFVQFLFSVCLIKSKFQVVMTSNDWIWSLANNGPLPGRW